MKRTNIIRVPEEFDEWVNMQMNHLIEECKLYGITKKNIPKTKILLRLTEKLKEDEQKNKKNYLSFLL